MAASDILNADLATVGAELRRGLEWWVDELRAMLPAGLRGGAGERAPATLEFAPDNARFAYFSRGALSPVQPTAGKAALALHPRSVLVRDMRLPRLSERDSRALVALDIDRLTPFRAEDVWFDLELAPGDPLAPDRPARLAVVTRRAAESALLSAQAAGIEPLRLGVAAPGAARTAFDFLPAIREAAPPPPFWARPRLWWSLFGLLVLANLLFAVWKDVADVRRLREEVAAQGDAVALASRLRARVTRENTERAALIADRSRLEPLGILEAAAIALPPPAWVQRLEWDGQTLRLTGFAPASVDTLAAMRRSAFFRNVRPATGDLAPTVLNLPPFDLSAEVAERPAA